MPPVTGQPCLIYPGFWQSRFAAIDKVRNTATGRSLQSWRFSF
jgi:hypothetical protein